jgi:TolB-like protein/DNA-binding winged helix-turn-helix (wHTH) protein
LLSRRVYQFGEFRLDCDSFELSRASHPVKLERKPMELLILLIERNGQLVTRDEIAEHLWGREVFVDTEHGINTAIRKIRQALRDDSEEPRFLQTVTGKGYRLHVPLEAVPGSETPARTSFEPAAEIQSPTSPQFEHLKLDDTAGLVVPGTNTLKRRSRVIILAASATLVVLAISFALFSDRLFGRDSNPQIHSIAVIPLDNLSGEPNQNYFADGMTDELITMLAKNSTLSVTSRTSVMQYKGVHRPLREIARELGVDGILEGSISRSGSKIHMTIQLIQAATDKHVWAESYDRDESEMVALPRDAAQDIAKRLNSAVVSTTPVRYISPAAHEAYIHGRYLWFAGKNDEAGEYFRKATELQPDYAPGWAGLANYYGAGAIDGDLDPAKSFSQEEAAATKAVQLDNSLPEAHLAMAAAYLINQWNWDRSLQEIDRAIQLDPKYSEAYHFRAKMLAALNRHHEAIEAQKKATELDPFARPFALAYTYQLARQYDAVLIDSLQREASEPGDVGVHWILSELYRCKGMKTEYVQELEKMFKFADYESGAVAVRHAFQEGGYNAVLRWRVSDFDFKARSSKGYASPVELATYYAELGHREEAISQLEQAFRQRSPQLLWIQCEPAFDFLHSDERYRSIIKRIGLPPAW